MKKWVIVLFGIFLLCNPIYAKGPKGLPYQGGNKSYQGAGIGREVSSEAKEIKESNATKGGFGESVRERARQKTRIQLHKQLKIQQKEERKSNSTQQF